MAFIKREHTAIVTCIVLLTPYTVVCLSMDPDNDTDVICVSLESSGAQKKVHPVAELGINLEFWLKNWQFCNYKRVFSPPEDS